jgi:hypothetical protein
MTEVEVFRTFNFDTNKCYEFALATRTEGRYPNKKYYSTNPLQYLGKYTHSERWGVGDSSGGATNFINNNKKTRILHEYDESDCFREVSCQTNGGKRKSKRKSKRNKKSRKTRRIHHR